MRSRRAALVFITVALTLSACEASSTPSKPKSGAGSATLGAGSTPASDGSMPGGAAGRAGARLSSPDGAFSVVLPKGWREDQATARRVGAVDAYAGPLADGFIANVNVVRERAGGSTVNRYAAQAIDRLRQRLAITLRGAVSRTEVDGGDARRYAFDDKQSGYHLAQQQTVTIRGGYGYVITYSAVSSAFESSLGAAQQIIASWRWS